MAMTVTHCRDFFLGKFLMYLREAFFFLCFVCYWEPIITHLWSEKAKAGGILPGNLFFFFCKKKENLDINFPSNPIFWRGNPFLVPFFWGIFSKERHLSCTYAVDVVVVFFKGRKGEVWPCGRGGREGRETNFFSPIRASLSPYLPILVYRNLPVWVVCEKNRKETFVQSACSFLWRWPIVCVCVSNLFEICQLEDRERKSMGEGRLTSGGPSSGGQLSRLEDTERAPAETLNSTASYLLVCQPSSL